MNNFGEKFTPWLAGLYEAQGHLRRAAEIFTKLQPEQRERASTKGGFFVYSAKAQPDQKEEEFAKLASLMAQWIELLRRRRFFDSKPKLLALNSGKPVLYLSKNSQEYIKNK